MNAKHQRLIDQLIRLPATELDDILDAVDAHQRTEEAGVRSFRQAFEQRAATSPYSPLAALLNTSGEDQ
jgi:hypothetical protein